MLNEQMNIVIAGHVDHGKSTIIGRLLADTHSLPEGKIETIKKYCELNSKPFEYAFLLDALKEEQLQGITIDSARVFFESSKRNYIIIDAPGHTEFLKNMISGASRAEAALLVIDAKEGVQENSKRHGFMLSMLGIRQIAVVINKMDLIGYDRDTFNLIMNEYSEYLKSINLSSIFYLPVSAREGENIISRNGSLKWYNGPTILDILDSFIKESEEDNLPFRMYVQDIYKFTNDGDDRRIIAGCVESGKISNGDEIIFYPSGKRSKVKSIEGFNSPVKTEVSTGTSAGFTLTDQIFITRGELACKAGEPAPKIGTRIKANIFWLGKNAFVEGREYLFKIGTLKVNAKLEDVHRIINSSDLSEINYRDEIIRNQAAECVLRLSKSAAFDIVQELKRTSRFVIVDESEISGGGIITECMEDELSEIRSNIAIRNFKWKKGSITVTQRSKRYNQIPQMVLITGSKGSGRTEVARELEKKLFEEGKLVYYIGIGSVKYGVDADIKNESGKREEHLRRFGEVANILLDSGMIIIATMQNINSYELELIKTEVYPFEVKVIHTGDEIFTEIKFNLKISDFSNVDKSIETIMEFIFQEK